MSIIKLSNVSKKYSNGTTALRNISLEIEAGEFTYIVGPSGAGKSTFIKLLYRELKIDRGSGTVAQYDLSKLKRRDVPMLRRSVGVVFQDYKLLPKKTVFENISYAMEVIGKSPREIKKRVNEVLDLVGLKHKIRSFPNELSGGEQQRVAIARSIANAPKVLKNSLIKAKKDSIIILTGHELLFYEEIIDELYILKDGKLFEEFDWKEEGLEKTYEKYF